MTTLLLLLATAATLPEPAPSPDAPVDLTAPSYTVVPVGDMPLPYQAVRLRQRFQNTGTGVLNALCVTPFLAIKGPGSGEYRNLTQSVFLVEPGQGLPAMASGRTWNPNANVQLVSGESLSRTSASAVNVENDRRVPLFPEPGGYFISWTGVNDYGRNVLVSVRAPEGADAAIYRLLQQDALLAQAIIAPMNIPDSQTAAQLEAIVRQSPNSTYADYARFALARARLRGWGLVALRHALTWSLKQEAEYLLEYLSNPRITKQFVFHKVVSELCRRDPLRGQELRIAEELEAARTGTDDDRRKAAERWAPFFYVSAEDRAAALAWLRQITRPGFAFRPHTLVIESRLIRIEQMLAQRKADTGPNWSPKRQWELFCDFQHPTVKPVTDILNRDYRDSIEWIREVLCSIKTEQEWRAFRVQPAPAAKGGGNGRE